MSIQFNLPRWYDLHVHLRQDRLLAPIIKDHLAAHCTGVLAMPNTKPPVAKVLTSDNLPYWSIESYQQMIQQAGGSAFKTVIVPLYLTKDTTPDMIEQGITSGLLKACKYYPPHGTTNAEHGRSLSHFIENGVFSAMAEYNVALCIHGEAHHLKTEQYFAQHSNAETLFYQNEMPRLRERFPTLKIVCEHVSTQEAIKFVEQAGVNTAATITPQHLLFTVGDLLQGFKYHLYCLPLPKFEQDRAALRHAAIAENNTQFFAGTDSAPHTNKSTACGCAAGCYTAAIGPQLYAQAFEAAGVDLSETAGQRCLQRFLCENGPQFYGLPIAEETMTLSKQPKALSTTHTAEGDIVPLPIGIQDFNLTWTLL